MNWPDECLVVIPSLNEAASIAGLVQSVRQYLPSVLVVDDGSSDRTAFLAKQAGAQVVSHPHSLGKGAALQTGWSFARRHGFPWVLSMDGDGQHLPDDIPALLRCAERTMGDLIVGNRMHDPGPMPRLRQWVNRWMSRRISGLAGRSLPDSQCGFRLMKLSAWTTLPISTTHFEIESEVLLKFARAGRRIEFVPVKSIYKTERSKIHPVHDTIRWFRWWRSVNRGDILGEPLISSEALACGPNDATGLAK